jgi:predicted RNA binding protein YcfA (HicA-like mRNA interferase family)
MTSKAQKLLERMRQSKASWKRDDLDRLYEGFGFVISHGKSHNIVKHPDFPELRATLPRHNYLAKGYVEYAVKLIDRLLEQQRRAGHEHEFGESREIG